MSCQPLKVAYVVTQVEVDKLRAALVAGDSTTDKAAVSKSPNGKGRRASSSGKGAFRTSLLLLSSSVSAVIAVKDTQLAVPLLTPAVSHAFILLCLTL